MTAAETLVVVSVLFIWQSLLWYLIAHKYREDRDRDFRAYLAGWTMACQAILGHGGATATNAPQEPADNDNSSPLDLS